jgi:hypothetical protein
VGLNEGVVDGNNLDIAVLDGVAEDDTANAAEPVDANLDSHLVWSGGGEIRYRQGEWWWGGGRSNGEGGRERVLKPQTTGVSAWKRRINWSGRGAARAPTQESPDLTDTQETEEGQRGSGGAGLFS